MEFELLLGGKLSIYTTRVLSAEPIQHFEWSSERWLLAQIINLHGTQPGERSLI